MSDFPYVPERAVYDTVDDGPDCIDALHAPLQPPADWGPGRWCRNMPRRCWQWVALPPPDAPQPPPDSNRPIMKGSWFDPGTSGHDGNYASAVTGRLLAETERSATENRSVTVVSIRLARCPIRQWSEPRAKSDVGELVMSSAEAAYLRDALTALLARMEAGQ